MTSASHASLLDKLQREVEERRRAEQRFKLVVEGAPNGIIMVDGNGRIVLVNRAAETLFRYARDELLGQPVEMLVPETERLTHPDYRARASPPLRRPVQWAADAT